MQPALIYTRYSPRPSVADVQSLEVQLERCEAYCKLAKLEPVHVVKDPETSARKIAFKNREGGEEVAQIMKSDGIKHIVAQRLDRVFRQVVDGLLQLDEWERKGISLHLADQGGCSINVGTATGKMLATTLLTFAEFEPNLTSEKTSDDLLRRQSNGQIVGSRPPYGTMRDPDDPTRWIPNPHEEAVIAHITHLAAEGYSDRKIASALATDGVRGRSGRISHQLIGRIRKRVS